MKCLDVRPFCSRFLMTNVEASHCMYMVLYNLLTANKRRLFHLFGFEESFASEAPQQPLSLGLTELQEVLFTALRHGMLYTVASPYFLRFSTLILQEINNNYLLGVESYVHISHITSVSLNVTRLFIQEATRYIRNRKVSYASTDFWVLQACIFL